MVAFCKVPAKKQIRNADMEQQLSRSEDGIQSNSQQQYAHPSILVQRKQAREALERAVAFVFDVECDAIVRCKRGRQCVAQARQVAMYLAHVVWGLSLTDVGLLFERDRTTVAHACRQIENRRDDRQFDCALDLLSMAMPMMLQRPEAIVIAGP